MTVQRFMSSCADRFTMHLLWLEITGVSGRQWHILLLMGMFVILKDWPSALLRMNRKNSDCCNMETTW